jgi:hypothetical protein
MYLTRQAAGFLLFVSLIVGMLGMFGLIKAGQADELDLAEGNLNSFYADEARQLGRDQPVTVPSALPVSEADDVADTAPRITVEPLLDESDIVSTDPTELAVVDDTPKPVQMRIAAHGIDAWVVPVGVEEDLSLEVPPAEQIGWYRYGPSPGAEGSAVLAAHVDYGGAPGAFFDLRHVVEGDRVEIVYDDGSVAYWEIVANRTYLKENVPVEELFDRSGEPRLVLVTCGGIFDRESRSYLDNVVAFARPLTP